MGVRGSGSDENKAAGNVVEVTAQSRQRLLAASAVVQVGLNGLDLIR
jgi:hypothetical protein